MRYGMVVITKWGTELSWVNGGFGYTKEEADKIVESLKGDEKFASYKVYELQRRR